MRPNPFTHVLPPVALLALTISPLVAEDTPPQPSTLLVRSNTISSHQPRVGIEKAAARQSDSLNPLRAILIQGQESLERCRRDIQDYTCTLIAQERIDGQLQSVKCCQAKVKHHDEPGADGNGSVSIYLKYKAPESIKGREVLWVAGQNDGKMLVRKGGSRLAFITALIEPTSEMATQNSRYTIHDFGIQRLVERMIEFGSIELAGGECQTNVVEDVDVDGRPCRLFEVIHPERRDDLPFHCARVYIDKELQLPTRFEAYDWPSEDDDQPVLIERYAYCDLQLNVGLTPEDFDKDNSEYQFR
ncbi:DUF1571 domain-containing protein [Stieleria sp.]|uniref:DUF1571 domain-containing protein n=1 Tax=Stieleria magnilauensis TaxID=2527963 RepID=A0ABX5XZC9_9BACT|nr:hypothetical protein TBK1r_61590 [Planctomycetes bacterium TBK1r]